MTIRNFIRAVLTLFMATPLAGAARQSPAPASAPGLEGAWEGTLGRGARTLRLIVTISKLSSGEMAGTLNSVDQHATLNIESASLAGDQVRFEVRAVGGLYEGTLSRDGSELNGTWTQTGVPAQPLAFQRSAAQESDAAKSAQAEHTPKPFTAPLDITVPMPPQAFRAGRKWHLVYELHVANYGKWDCLVTRLDILPSAKDAKPLASYSGAELESLVARPGQTPAEKSKIGQGLSAVIYLWLTLDAAEKLDDVPSSLTHRIAMKIGDYPEAITLEGVPVAVNRAPVVVVDPPLRGDNWLAVNGPSNTSLHRRALIPINGRAYISQRYAIDWVRLYPEGKTYKGDEKDNKNYRAYGAEIHSSTDGVVSSIKDGIPQNTPGENSRAVPITLETIGGNHVIVDIGNGLYAFYAHLQLGSLRVKVGDKVRRGDILGLVGNSGNSSEPHLHFQICDANSELASEGVPFAFLFFQIQGHGWDFKSADSVPATVLQESELPLEDDVVSFPAP